MSKFAGSFRDEIEPYLAEFGGRKLRLGMGGAYVGIDADAEQREGFHRTLCTAYERGLRYFGYVGAVRRIGVPLWSNLTRCRPGEGARRD